MDPNNSSKTLSLLNKSLVIHHNLLVCVLSVCCFTDPLCEWHCCGQKSGLVGPMEPVLCLVCISPPVCIQWAATWWSAGRSACRCTSRVVRLVRDSHHCHMTLAGGFRCYGDISFFLHQGWLVIWVKVILLPRSLRSPPRLGNAPPSDILTVDTLPHTLPTDRFARHTVLGSSYFLLLSRLLRNC